MTATTEETAAATTEEPQAQQPVVRPGRRPFVYTPFQAHKDVNEALAKEGLANLETGEGCIQGPMAYSYAKQGRFRTFPATADVAAGVPKSKVRLEVDRESFAEFLKEFIKDRKGDVEKAETKDAEAKEADADTAQVEAATDAAMQEAQTVVANEVDDEEPSEVETELMRDLQASVEARQAAADEIPLASTAPHEPGDGTEPESEDDESDDEDAEDEGDDEESEDEPEEAGEPEE